jgi:crossover junction endodeoxyribonuclease RuvC
MRTVIGIDPGISGAIALLTGNGDLRVEDMPTMTMMNGDRRIDQKALASMLREWDFLYEPQLAVVEHVHAMPKQGVVSSFNFGYSVGSVHQALASVGGLEIRLVQPQVWKAIYGLRGGPENKDASRTQASLLFPRHGHLWARKKDHGRAEAVLLANYGSNIK